MRHPLLGQFAWFVSLPVAETVLQGPVSGQFGRLHLEQRTRVSAVEDITDRHVPPPATSCAAWGARPVDKSTDPRCAACWPAPAAEAATPHSSRPSPGQVRSWSTCLTTTPSTSPLTTPVVPRWPSRSRLPPRSAAGRWRCSAPRWRPARSRGGVPCPDRSENVDRPSNETPASDGLQTPRRRHVASPPGRTGTIVIEQWVWRGAGRAQVTRPWARSVAMASTVSRARHSTATAGARSDSRSPTHHRGAARSPAGPVPRRPRARRTGGGPRGLVSGTGRGA